MRRCPARSVDKALEPVVVIAIVAGLVALFFQNRPDVNELARLHAACRSCWPLLGLLLAGCGAHVLPRGAQRDRAARERAPA